MAQGNSFTGRVYLGTDTTAQSLRSVVGAPSFAAGDQQGDLAVSDNGQIYACDGANWSPLVNADGQTTMTAPLNVQRLTSGAVLLGSDGQGNQITVDPRFVVTEDVSSGAGLRAVLGIGSGTVRLTAENQSLQPTALNLAIGALQVNGAPGTSGQVLTSAGSGAAPTWQNPTGGGAVYAGALTVYVDGTNGTDAPGGGTLGAPYRTINYAYSQVTSLGNVNNNVYNAQVGQYITEKLVFRIAPGRYVENVTLGFKRARVQLIGIGVQIIGNVSLLVNRADFPAGNMEAIKSSFPAPWTAASSQNTFEVTGEAGGGVEADASADPLFITGLTSLVFNEPTVPAIIASGTAWENNYGTFYFYANKANLIGGMIITTAYVTTSFRAMPTCVVEIDSCTIGEGSSPVRTYLGGVPYAFVTGTGWTTGTGVATGAQTANTLQDTTKNWTPNQWVGSTVTITSGTGAGQSRTVQSNTATALTIQGANWNTNPVAGSSVYSLIGTTNEVGDGTITLKTHNSTIGAAIGARLTLGEIDGCRLYDIDRTMLGTVINGTVTGSISSSYLGMVVNQFRQFSGTGIAPSQYQIGAASTTRLKYDSTSYTTMLFNRSNSTGALTARTINLSAFSGTASGGTATTLTIAAVTGTATSGTTTTLVDTTKSWTTNQFAGGTITITGGTGNGQSRTVLGNTSNTVIVTAAWTTTPDATSTYSLTWSANQFNNATITTTGGTGSGQTRTITTNNITSLSVSTAWTVTPDATTTYTITTTQFDFQDDARSLAYTPGTSANWVAPAPATVQAALDRIAAAVFVLRGNSAIP